MTDNEARARELAATGCGCDPDTEDGCVNFKDGRCTFSAFMIAKALDAAEDRGRAAGLREARTIARDGHFMANPETVGDGIVFHVRTVVAAITARLTALSADTPANRGEG